MIIPISEIVERRPVSKLKTLSVAASFGVEIIKHPELAMNLVRRNGVAFAASIDVTPNCNLRCSHCYLYGKSYQEEGTQHANFLDQVDRLIEEVPTLIHTTWVGGETLLRKETVREGTRRFKMNWVVTNGTVPIDGDWPNTIFHISIDGTERAHNSIRQPWKPNSVSPGSPLDNVYQTAKRTAAQATAPVFVHTVINQENASSIPALVEEWYKEGHVQGFAFSLHTPIVDQTRPSGMSENDESLYLGGAKRVAIVQMLHGLKDVYGRFINMSHSMIDNYHPDLQSRAYGSNCRIVATVHSVDTRFQRKSPCVMGEGMDCNRCGCVIPSMVERSLSLDLEALVAILPSLAYN